MRAFVFTDRALASEAGRFVWLAINTEDAKNAALTKQLGIAALPTFFVLNPTDQKVALRWVGGATTLQLLRILEDGRAAVAGAAVKSPADRALAEADRLYGESRNAEAAKAYLQALAAAPVGWPHYARAVESALFALGQSDSCQQAAVLARDAYPRLRLTSSAADVASSGLDCAIELPAHSPGRKQLVAVLEADTREVVSNLELPISGDDRSGAYGSLIGARKDAEDSIGVRRVTEAWASFLEGEAARARTPDARAVYDSHRLSAYLALGQPERAIPMLKGSERELPDDYNPPARLAAAYKAMKRWDDALAASDRALSRAYGPRKLRMLTDRADILVGRGDAALAKQTLDQAIAIADALPPGQRSEQTIASLKKKRDSLN